MPTETTHIDRAILRLLEERARLRRIHDQPAARARALRIDLERRASGDLDSGALTRVLAAIDEATAPREARP